MAVYYLMYGFSVFIMWFFAHLKTEKTEEQRNKIVCILCFLSLILVLSLRHPSMGVDLRYGESTGYLGMFSRIARSNWSEVFTNSFQNYEKGYVIFCKLISLISANKQFFLAVCAITSVLPVAAVLGKRSSSPLFSFVIYMGLPVIQMLFSGLRQSIAIAICFLSITYIQQRKPIAFLVAVLIAASFHSSALIFLPFYFIYRIKIKRNIRFITVAILPILFVFRVSIFSFLTSIFGKSADIADNGALRLLIFFIILYVFCFMLSDDTEDNIGYLNLFYFACFFQCFSGINTLVMRIGFYFMLPLTLLLPDSVGKIRNKNTERLIKAFLIVFFVAYGLYVLHSKSYAMSYPYSFFWND